MEDIEKAMRRSAGLFTYKDDMAIKAMNAITRAILLLMKTQPAK